MAEIGTESDSESKIWRLTGLGAGFGFLVFGSGFGVNSSDSAHLWSIVQHLVQTKKNVVHVYHVVVND